MVLLPVFSNSFNFIIHFDILRICKIKNYAILTYTFKIFRGGVGGRGVEHNIHKWIPKITQSFETLQFNNLIIGVALELTVFGPPPSPSLVSIL